MQSVREVYSLLMPVHGGRVILPRAAIAEVTGYTRPKDRPEDAPAFVLGFIDWQGQRIPLVSFEAARGEPVPELGRRTRVAVLFGIANRLQPNVFAVVTQGYPYLVRVNENVLQHEPMDAEEPLVLARVRMANEKPLIPNLEQLEILIAEGLGDTGAGQPEGVVEEEPVDELEALDAGDEEELDALLLDDGNDVELSGENRGREAPEASAGLGEPEGLGDETDNIDATGEMPEQEASEASVNLDEVTAFGVETDYSAELGELSSALESGESAEAGEEAEEFEIDLSGLEVESEDGETDSTAAGEIDFSDLEIDFDEDKEPKGP